MRLAARIPQARVHVARREGHFLLLDDRGSVPAAVGEFLAAANIEDSQVWRGARTAGRADAAAQLRSDGLGALPWGAVSAVVRRALAR